MKPVLVQNLIQAAKKRRGKPLAIKTLPEPRLSDRHPAPKDRSSSIIFAGLILFFVIVILTASVV